MVLLKSLAILFALGSLTVHQVRSQTCETTNTYSACSANSACDCLPIAFADNLGICGLLAVSCSRLSACEPNDSCPSSDQICIRHPRCGSASLCYPLSMSDPRLCPPISSTTTPTSTAAPFFTRPVTPVGQNTGYPFSDTTSDSMDGAWLSHYYGALITASHVIPGQNKYYETITIRARTSGTYYIRSESALDTYGCLYEGEYNPASPMACNDDDQGRQFGLNVCLQADTLYTLLVTTYSPSVTGSYSVVARGPAGLQFNRVDSTPGTPTMPFETTGAPVTSQGPIVASYSSSLTASSSNLPGQNKYYEAMYVDIDTSGVYTFSTRENLNGVLALYVYSFYPTTPMRNRMSVAEHVSANGQPSFSIYLEARSHYVLVFTTAQENVTGPFTILASGPSAARFTRREASKTTTASFQLTTPRTGGNEVVSEYSSALTQRCGKYARLGRPERDYFYEAIMLMVNTSGVYTFSSQSVQSESESNSTDGDTFTSESPLRYGAMDAYGYLYGGRFSTVQPEVDLLQGDDDSAGAGQFRLTASLEGGRAYVLVFTTYRPNIVGSFSITASGPAGVDFYWVYSD